jgi:hypothetical protein
MDIQDSRERHLSRRFKSIKKMRAHMLDREIRKERRMLKKAMSKRRRKNDQNAMKNSFVLMDE